MSIDSNPSTSVPLSTGQGTVEKPDEFGDTPEGKAKRWRAELDTSKRDRHNWSVRADKVLRRYKDERDTINQSDRLFNILWSNVQVMKPAIYAKPPKPEVSRKFDTSNNVQRVAALMMERNLEYFVCEHSLFDSVLSACVLDRLLPGQGTAWIRYDAILPPAPESQFGKEFGEEPDPNAPPQAYAQHEATETPGEESVEHANAQVTEDAYQIPTGESVCYDYVHWRDFRCNPARTWEEVTWVARRVFMDRAQGEKRFGAEVFKDVPLNYKEEQVKANDPGNKEFGPGKTVVAKAAVWEIWDKVSKTVLWLCEDYAKLLDEKRDLLELTGFFPCPKPLLATTTTDSIIPIPDYCLYQDQAQELDQVTNRISLLMQALKVIGVYDKSQTEIQRLLTEGVDNVMIPVDNWGMFAERGGIKGTVDFFPVDMVSKVLAQLIQDRNTIKQDIYEITGIADIVRGSTVASETATAQDLKAKFAGIRINDSQKDIARFAADLLNMSAEVITNFFQPETIVTNADLTPEDVDFQYVPEAIQLIKNKALIKHRITVSVDAITEPDRKEEQQARVEFLTALGQFMQQSAAATTEHPELASMMGHIVLWGVRGFSVGRELEGVIEQGIKAVTETPPEPKPDPAAEKAKAEAAAEQQRMAAEMEQMKAEGAQRAAEMQQRMALEKQQSDLKIQQMQQELQLAREENDMKLRFMQQEFDLRMQQMLKEHEFKMAQLQQTAAVKVQVAQQAAEVKMESAQIDGAVKAAAGEQALEQQEETHEQTMEQQAAAAAAAAKQTPKGE